MYFRFGGMDFDFDGFDCLLEINVNGQMQQQRGSRPQMIWEMQFRQLVDELGRHPAPAYVKLSRQKPIFNNFGDKVNDIELSIQFKNNAYISMYGETNED